ncbi:MAG TPA: hypothetical protein VFK44_03940 [Bacillales bacterium]|nr:hypothetical protein [Bacillales bacterium]
MDIDHVKIKETNFKWEMKEEVDSDQIFEAIMGIKEQISILDQKVSHLNQKVTSIQEMVAVNTKKIERNTGKLACIEGSMEVLVQETHDNKRDIRLLKKQA